MLDDWICESTEKWCKETNNVLMMTDDGRMAKGVIIKNGGKK